MIDITTKSGKRIGRISDDRDREDVIYIDGKPFTLEDTYNDPKLMQKFNDELKRTNAIKLED